MSANKTTDTVLLYSGGVEPRIPSVFLADHSQRGDWDTGLLSRRHSSFHKQPCVSLTKVLHTI